MWKSIKYLAIFVTVIDSALHSYESNYINLFNICVFNIPKTIGLNEGYTINSFISFFCTI